MDTELEVLGELLVELLVVLLVLSDLGKHLEALFDDVLLHDLEDLVLLEGLTRDVKGKILGVDDALHEGEPLGDDLLAVVHDEDTAHVELDVVLLLLLLKEVERRSLGDEEEGTELERTLNAEVLQRQMVLPIIGKALVEASVLLASDLVRLPHPDGLNLVEGLELLSDLLDLLGLLFLFFSDLFDLWLILTLRFIFFFVLIIIRVGNFAFF